MRGMMRAYAGADGGDGSRNPCWHGACAVGDGACRASWRGWARWRRRWRASSSNRARSRRSPGLRADAVASTTRWRFVPCLPRSVGFLPVSWPPGAGTAAESSAARSQSMRSAWASSSRSTWCSLRQTPAWYQSRSLRQHVIPLPHPISAGKYSQGMPVFSTNRIPVSADRSDTPGPSALGLRRLRREQRRDPRPERIRQQFLRHGTLLHGFYSASLAAYATVLLGVLSHRVTHRLILAR